MGKVITVSVPDWVDERKFREAFLRALLESSPEKVSIDELRKLMGISETEESIEIPAEIGRIREKDKRRLEWLS
ncbi:hypothetical protein A3L09_00900 [Thermococcus profundus]|uniref:Uncharacterized protein n=1 Tax=Thermococcus profundus TaxID=49899 RepID=A0A2Z2MIY9_THEPR|nr:hypothetical protein [Thermococcus profundus]ASJ01918.1 hypothetical protein A3L09_00900 [Thermococcus profundus]